MSHFKEREERNCLNCNAIVHGKYCHICGQENIHPRETVWHLISHFFQDITHFDGKFFSTLKLLILKPGFISREYMLGRRASYLNPIRMYVFTSAIFFLLFFSVVHVSQSFLENSVKAGDKTMAEISAMDSVEFSKFTVQIQQEEAERNRKEKDSLDTVVYNPMTRDEFSSYLTAKLDSGAATPWGKYRNKAEYDSALAHGKDHNWIERKITYKMIALREKYSGQKQIFAALGNELLHSLPQLIFVSLPLFALLLHLLYRRKRRFYYVNHGIFSIHFFVFVFISLMVVLGLDQLVGLLHWNWLNYVKLLIIFFIFFYCYKAMRNFYQQGRAKTIIKFFLLQFANIFVIILLFIIFFFFSLFKI